MQISHLCDVFSFIRSLAKRPQFTVCGWGLLKLFAAALIISLVLGCGTRQMSLKEAKQVAVSMSAKPFTAPPRRIDDILTVLQQPGRFDVRITKKFKRKLNKIPPQTEDPAALAHFYHQRGRAAFQLGYEQQALDDLRQAWGLARKTKNYQDKGDLLFMLGKAEIALGHFKKGVKALDKSLRRGKGGTYRELVKIYTKLGDFERAESYLKLGAAHLRGQMQARSGRGRRSPRARFPEAVIAQMQATLASGQGKFSQAENNIRKALAIWTAQQNQTPRASIGVRINLAKNLMQQARFVEAEIEIRAALQGALGFAGRDSALTTNAVRVMASILAAQGRLTDAEKLARAGLAMLERIDKTSRSAKQFRNLLGDILTASSAYNQAMQQFDHQMRTTPKERYLKKRAFRNPNLLLALLQTGRVQEAMPIIAAAYGAKRKMLGLQHPKTLEMLALSGMAAAQNNQPELALQNFAKAVPFLLELREQGEEFYVRTQRLKAIVEAYISLLGDVYGTALEQSAGIDAASEAFKLVDSLIGRSVQRALGASGSRAAVIDPALSDLLRNEQDMHKQIQALETSLTELLAATPGQTLSSVIDELQAKIKKLKTARGVIFHDIQQRFPKYTDFTHPEFVTIKKIKQQLNPGEAFVAIYISAQRTFVWAIPFKGANAFNAVLIGREAMGATVKQLRLALDCNPQTLGDIPAFDIDSAYDLYAQLLKPVAGGWKDADDLLIVASRPLDQLPFAVLPTTPVKPDAEKHLLFAEYRQVPWLLRRVSITRLPSATSLATLRSLPAGKPGRKAFIGFGDPLFNLRQLAQEQSRLQSRADQLAGRGGNVHVRAIRVSEKGVLDNNQVNSIQLGHLNRLPDTAEEIKSIALALGADPDEDVFIGKQAAESRVKGMDLSLRRVIAFASHALVPGDLDGLQQPAIALSAPSVTGGGEDGLLTMEEIFGLKLNADWVVLSACNTGAAYGEGAEALSGLGQAFFYAGTRAMLVSMWPVETVAAKMLTTRLFQFQKQNPSLSRSRALRKSMLALIDGPGRQVESTGKTVASYAHPMFWAPFIVVGDGG